MDSLLEKMQMQNMEVRMAVMKAVGMDRAIELLKSRLVVNPMNLLESAVRKEFITADEITKEVVASAEEEAYDIDDTYRDSGEGIGTSDMNCFIASMLNGAGIKFEVVNGRFERV
jgi:hypothetical protein